MKVIIGPPGDQLGQASRALLLVRSKYAWRYGGVIIYYIMELVW